MTWAKAGVSCNYFHKDSAVWHHVEQKRMRGGAILVPKAVLLALGGGNVHNAILDLILVGS